MPRSSPIRRRACRPGAVPTDARHEGRSRREYPYGVERRGRRHPRPRGDPCPSPRPPPPVPRHPRRHPRRPRSPRCPTSSPRPSASSRSACTGSPVAPRTRSAPPRPTSRRPPPRARCSSSTRRSRRRRLSLLLRLPAKDGEKEGFVVVDMTDVDRFAPIEGIVVPPGPLSLVTDVERGDDLASWSPDEALPELTARGRTPPCCTRGSTGRSRRRASSRATTAT